MDWRLLSQKMGLFIPVRKVWAPTYAHFRLFFFSSSQSSGLHPSTETQPSSSAAFTVSSTFHFAPRAKHQCTMLCLILPCFTSGSADAGFWESAARPELAANQRRVVRREGMA